VLGPNPSAQLERMKQLLQVEVGKSMAGKESAVPPRHMITRMATNPSNYQFWAIRRAESMWDIMRGVAETPHHQALAGSMGFMRQLATATSLGSAILSSFGDVGTAIMRRHYAGLPITKVFSDTLRQFKPENFREAVRAGLIMESSLNVLHEEARFAGTMGGKNWLSFLGDRVLTLSGLNAWTQTCRHAHGMGMMAELADKAGHGFDRLDARMQRIFGQYGIDSAAWDKIRSAQVHETEDGLRILRANEVDRIDPIVADHYLDMLHGEMEHAVPTGLVRARSILVDKTKAGTVVGEMTRSAATFKMYSTTFMLLHGGTIAREIGAGRVSNAMGYAAGLTALLTAFGAVTLQLKSLAQGKDPRPMTSPWSAKFFGAAFLQGGGAGIYGDLLFSDTSRMGSGAIETLMGPVAGRIEQLRKIAVGQALQPLNEDQRQNPSSHPTPLSRQLIDLARTNTPGGNIWYLRLLYERMVLDRLQVMYDPEAWAAFRRKVDNTRRTYGNGFWWPPGVIAPDFGS
jgi:hypothetical protein